MNNINLYTIGFSKKSAESFLQKLKNHNVKKILDIRLNNSSQLAGYTKKDDLKYFLKTICGIEYVHLPELAPTKEILDRYKKQKGSWKKYENSFISLLQDRAVEKHISDSFLSDSCLLCSENKPEFCHRRLVAEYLKKQFDN